MPALEVLNKQSKDEAEKALFLCCSSSNWAKGMVASRPFSNAEAIFLAAERIWFSLSKSDWLEAFSHHPRIGADIEILRQKFQATKKWSSEEQAGVEKASEEILLKLQQGNVDYEKKYGHVFLICATGKSADEMLQALNSRIGNDEKLELKNAAIEQSKITKIRLQKLLAS